MQKIFVLIALVCGLFLLSSCQRTSVDRSAVRDIPVRTSPVNVADTFITTQAIEPLAIDIDQGNLFHNGGFEDGLDGWTGCEANAVTVSSDAYEGTKGLAVNAGNCFYRSVAVSADQDLILSCYARLQSGNGWTGMGLGFADASWTTIDAGPSTIITGNTYQRYDITATAPAGSKYASMWLYSDNPVVVDNCSLMLEETPPPPPVGSGDDLLDNSTFDYRDYSQTPTTLHNWTAGCGGDVQPFTINRTRRGVRLRQGACLDQGLSASDIEQLKGKEFTYSCLVRNEATYAAISIFLDGEATSKTIPSSNSYQTIDLKGTAGQISNGFVSLYAQGEGEQYLQVDDCSLTVDGDIVQPPVGDNLLDNSAFESLDANNNPSNWVKGCGGSWASVAGLNGNGLQLENGVCIDQTLSSSDLSELSGNNFTYSCYAKNTGGYASMTIFLNGQAESVVIPVSNNYQLINLPATAGQLSSGFVSIYSEADLTVDNCSLEIAGNNPPQPVGTPSIDVRNQVEGNDSYASQGPFTFELAVRNNGDVLLENVSLNSDKLSCDTDFPSLAIGETKTTTCTSDTVINPSTGPFTHTVTATATTTDGRVVTDSDAASYTLSFRASPRAYIDIATDNRIVPLGSDVTFFVTLANAGNVSGIAEVESNVADCTKQFTPALTPTNVETYQCVATNVQESFYASVNVVSVGAYTIFAQDSVEVVIEDSVSVDISSAGDVVNVGGSQNPEPYSFTINIRNSGAVALASVQVSSDAVQTCTSTIGVLETGETTSYTCEAPTLAAGQRIIQTVTALATTSDARQATDSATTEIYRQSDVKLDVSLGAEGDDVITINSGESVDAVVTLKNTGFVDFNNIQSLYIWRSNPYDGTICQAAIPYSGIGDPDIAFDLAVGETKTFTCTLQNVSADVELNLVAYFSNTNERSFLPNEEVFSYDPDTLFIKVN